MKTRIAFTRFVIPLLLVGMGSNLSADQPLPMPNRGGFARDVEFLQERTRVVVLERGKSAVAVAPAYQGRVMTSTFDSAAGPSFGWINRPVVEQGFLSDSEKKGKLQEHIYVFGGEERFWLGPEGGQFGLFFAPGSGFAFDEWFAPPALDTEAFELVEQGGSTARFRRRCELINASGTRFQVGIQRTINVLGESDATTLFGGARIDGEPADGQLGDGLQVVGYESDNRITNRGEDAWTPETGLLSIWLLGMYQPSPLTTVVIPIEKGPVERLGLQVNDAYFGSVPPEHLRVEEGVLYFKGDGTRRGKIGVSARRSRGVAGSYDAAGGVLTLVSYNVQAAPHGFVNSAWELQDQPYAGDVINAYNDGPPEPGAAPLGPFYELETSSPAAALKPGETLRHVQQTWHIQGEEEQLDPIARRLLGVSLQAIKSAF